VLSKTPAEISMFTVKIYKRYKGFDGTIASIHVPFTCNLRAVTLVKFPSRYRSTHKMQQGCCCQADICRMRSHCLFPESQLWQVPNKLFSPCYKLDDGNKPAIQVVPTRHQQVVVRKKLFRTCRRYQTCWNNLMLRVCWPHQPCHKMITTWVKIRTPGFFLSKEKSFDRPLSDIVVYK
jgi:hypothetical protein